MKANSSKVEKILARLFLIANSLIFVFLFYFSFRYSYVNTDIDVEFPAIRGDSLPVNVAGVLLIVLIFMCIHFLPEISVRVAHTGALILSALSSIISYIWIHSSATTPFADQLQICLAASAINRGDYSMLEKGAYLAKWPQNLGITTFLRVLFALFGDWNTFPFKIFAALMVFPLVYGISRITVHFSKSEKLGLVSAFAIFACIPVYFYTSFIYGEIISTSFAVMAVWSFLRSLDKPGPLNYFLMVFFTFAAVCFRKNTLIIFLALLVVCLLKLFFENGKKRIIAILAMIIAGMILPSVVNKIIYSGHISPDAKPIPAILYVQMGLNMTEGPGCYGYGWYDNSIQTVFEECGYSQENASSVAKEMIRERIGDFCGNIPGMADFYKIKISTQWNAPMYQSIVMNNKFVWNDQNDLAKTIYNNKTVWNVMDNYMNIYQLFAYLGILLAGVFMIKNFREASGLTCMIAVFGGFLFSVIWEAKTRYVFPYLLLMIPNAVIGMYLLSGMIRDLFCNKKAKNERVD